MNDFLLLNQNISANVTIIKFELVWEEKYVTIICWRYRKIKIQTTFSKVSVRHETCLLTFFFRTMQQRTQKIFSQSISYILLYSYAIYQITFICTYILLKRQKHFNVRPIRFHEFHTNWKIQSKYRY